MKKIYKDLYQKIAQPPCFGKLVGCTRILDCPYDPECTVKIARQLVRVGRWASAGRKWTYSLSREKSHDPSSLDGESS